MMMNFGLMMLCAHAPLHPRSCYIEIRVFKVMGRRCRKLIDVGVRVSIDMDAESTTLGDNMKEARVLTSYYVSTLKGYHKVII